MAVALRNTRGNLNPLPCTREEATQILAQVTEPKQTTSALDFDANQPWITKASLNQYRMVHFATHGLIDSKNPALSSLVLSRFNSQKQEVADYWLSLNEIFNLKLSADLVVLSACKTGLGQEVRGEGIVGLTRGFMYAGAKRVVVSLWNVNDKSTADLMSQFYREMLRRDRPLSPAAALRHAQKQMWETHQQHPYYWSAFTLQGLW